MTKRVTKRTVEPEVRQFIEERFRDFNMLDQYFSLLEHEKGYKIYPDDPETHITVTGRL